MSPILDIQQQLREAGRIRIGEQVATGKGKAKRPAKIDTLRFTSADKQSIDALAALYGGEVKAWDSGDGVPQWEVKTKAKQCRIIVPPYNYLEQWYELWSGGGCQRRCDGETAYTMGGERTRGVPCQCPPDREERAELSKDGKACKATTRLWVMLPDLDGFGTWRLESHGFYAAAELGGMAQLLASASAANSMMPGRLALEERTSKVPGQGTRRYVVPVIHVDISAEALAAGRNDFARLPESTETHSEAEPDQSVAALAAPQDNPTEAPATTEIASSETREPSRGEVVRFLVMCREAGIDDDRRHEMLGSASGGRVVSTKEATVAELSRAEALLASTVRSEIASTVRAYAGLDSACPPGATEEMPEGSDALTESRGEWLLKLAPMAPTKPPNHKGWPWETWAKVYVGLTQWATERMAAEEQEQAGEDLATQEAMF